MRERRRSKGEQGQAIVLVALMLVAIFGAAALAFDGGLAMSQRRLLQADVDSAALAGARSYPQGADQANWVAMQYLARNVGFTLPLGACVSPTACPAGTYTAGAFGIVLGDNSSPPSLDVSLQQTQPSVFGSVIGISRLVSGTSARAMPVGPTMTGSLYAVAAVSGDVLVNGGGVTSDPTGNVSGPVYAYGSFGSKNKKHAPAVPAVQTNYDGTACPGSPQNHVDNGGVGNNLDYQWQGGSGSQRSAVSPPTVFDNSGPATSGPVYTSVTQAQDGQGNWNPGIYNGFYPNGGHMNGGVYKLINVTSTISLGSITNTVHTVSGTSDPTGAVAIVLDSSDTGSLDVGSAVLNGIDDLYPSTYKGQRDPMGTHNFVFFSPSGQSGYGGNVTIRPPGTTDLSGIIYIPNSQMFFDGNASPQFTGSVIVAALTINGGGNGTQQFNWVCGLNSVAGTAYQGGLVR